MYIYPQVTSVTQTGRLVIKKEVKPPVITITQPIVLPNGVIKTYDKNIVIKGGVKDEVEIISLSVNKIESKLNNGEFTVFLELVQGENSIDIIAVDKNKKRTEYYFKIIKEDVKPPEFAIIEPIIPDGSVLETKKQIIFIKGKSLNDSVNTNIKINNKPVIMSGAEFKVSVNLKAGLNTIIIKDVNSYGISSEKILVVNYDADTTGPIVTISEPAVTRGVVIVSKKDVMHIQGNATDESGIKEIYVNNNHVSFDEKGNFNSDIALIIGDNKLIVNAIDNKDNTTIDTFYIQRKAEEIISVGKYYAFVIGIDKYSGTWPALKNAVHDAKSIEDEIKKDYGFQEIISLYNIDATRANIISKFEELSLKMTKDDNLLIFYSGHGDFKEQYNKGYWVPIDATSNSTVSFISNSDIQTYINGIKSKHILLVADACFTGDIFRGQTSELPFEKSDRYIIDAYSKPSRFAMTSGNIQPVADGGKDNHSVFTYYLLKYMKENTARYFSARELFNDIERPVINNSDQEPQYKPLKNTGDEGGQFIFIRKQGR